MDWYLILAIAIPFLFVIGVVNNALKEQHRLEKRMQSRPPKLSADSLDREHLKAAKRKAPKAWQQQMQPDEDDYGLAPRQDLRRAAADAAAAAKAGGSVVPSGTAHEDAAVTDSKENKSADGSAQATMPEGNTEASDAASYFSRYSR